MSPPSVDNLRLLLMLAVPGIVILYVRAQFLGGRMPALKDGVIEYAVVSFFYYALAAPALPFVAPRLGPALWFLLLFGAPVLAGAVLGLNARHGWLRLLLGRLDLGTLHSIDSAWDWKFSNLDPCWVLATLKDGTRWAGYLDGDSFISSDPAERDLYIGEVYEIGAENRWIARGSGVWIANGEVRTLEFWPDRPPKDPPAAQQEKPHAG